MNERELLIESVLDIFRKKDAGEKVSYEELNKVITRFRELVSAERK